MANIFSAIRQGIDDRIVPQYIQGIISTCTYCFDKVKRTTSSKVHYHDALNLSASKLIRIQLVLLV